MPDFHLPDSSWEEALTAAKSNGVVVDCDRTGIELICGIFVESRKSGKNLQKPQKQRKAWRKISKSAVALLSAMEELDRDQQAADLEVLKFFGLTLEPHALARDLAALAICADTVATVEGSVLSPATKSDPNTDWFVNALINQWKARGGRVGTSVAGINGEEGGPLIRFLLAITASAFKAAGIKSPTKSALRARVRKFADMAD